MLVFYFENGHFCIKENINYIEALSPLWFSLNKLYLSKKLCELCGLCSSVVKKIAITGI